MAHDWLASSLDNREQTVLSRNKSYTGRMDLGVPQGSILAPMLFVVFMSDVEGCCSGLGRAVLYADYTNILLRNANLNQLVCDSNKVSQMFSESCHDNGLALNSDKTIFI